MEALEEEVQRAQLGVARKQMQEAQVRQVPIVDTAISEDEARKLVEDPAFDGQVFSQAVCQRILWRH